jgi:methylmalonyl-CoA mutase N-terminal domain/subunit
LKRKSKAGERIIVGRNKFQVKEDEQPELLRIDFKVQEEQIKFLHKVRSERNKEEVEKKLDELKTAAKGENNLMPYIIAAVRSYASVGEICNTMRAIYGEYKETVVI